MLPPMTLEVLSAGWASLVSTTGGALPRSWAILSRAVLSCPYCSSEQPFPVRTRPHEGSDTVIEVYISCTRCPFEQQLRLSTVRLEHLHSIEARLRNEGVVQTRRFGKPTGVNDLALMRIQELMQQEEAVLHG